MKQLKEIIQEKLVLNKNSKAKEVYNYHPKTKDELKKLIKNLIIERGDDADLNDIDISNINELNGLFYDLDPHNIDISNWDVSHVTNMSLMFFQCVNFNSDLSNWDVSQVTNMDSMFSQCRNFNSDLSNWDVSNVLDMSNMFFGCNKFYGKEINKWTPPQHTDMYGMFDKTPLEKYPPKWYKK